MRQANRIGWALFYTTCYVCVSAILLGCTAAFWPLIIISAPLILFGGVGAWDAWAKAFGKRPV